MTTPADELRTAAEKIRRLSKAIDAPGLPDQSWHTEACASEERGDCPCIVAQGSYEAGPYGTPQPMYYVADAETPECAAYIAAMHPGVGVALADWLDNTATSLAANAHPGWQDLVAADALAVARAINAAATPAP
jgi:hypothetical protein